jgi:sugar transferase (PEP-CTERM/EpsH1 system associated)
MKILIVTPEWPYPLNQGGRIRMFNVIKQLAKSHEIHLISVTLQPLMTGHHDALTPFCASLRIVPQPSASWRIPFRVAKSILTRKPFVVFKHLPKELPRVVDTMVSEVRPDVVLVEFHYLSDCLKGLDVHRVVDMHNLDTMLYDRFAHGPRWGLKKIHGRMQRGLMREFESQLPRRFDACVTVSDNDATLLKTWSNASNIYTAPNGVDVDYFTPGTIPLRQLDLVFTGSMDYYPNVDAVLFLCREVMPSLWARRPQTTLAIVGRNPTSAVKALGNDPRITVTGAVADIRPYLIQSAVVVVPLRMGGGTRLKVLEAAAMGKAIVGTPIGFEGIEVVPNQHVLVSDNAGDFAQAVFDLLTQPALAERLGLAARNLICEHYSWPACVARLEEVMRLVAQSGSQA